MVLPPTVSIPDCWTFPIKLGDILMFSALVDFQAIHGDPFKSTNVTGESFTNCYLGWTSEHWCSAGLRNLKGFDNGGWRWGRIHWNIKSQIWSSSWESSLQGGAGCWSSLLMGSCSLQCQAFRHGLQVGQAQAIKMTRNIIIHLCLKKYMCNIFSPKPCDHHWL